MKILLLQQLLNPSLTQFYTPNMFYFFLHKNYMCIKKINGQKIIKYSLIVINGSIEQKKNVVNAYIVFFFLYCC